MLPVGNASNVSAYFDVQLRRVPTQDGPATRTPAMWGFQAEGAAPLVHGSPVQNPETVATAIRIGNPASWTLAKQARDDSGGRIGAVSDAQILSAQREIASREGTLSSPLRPPVSPDSWPPPQPARCRRTCASP